MKKKLLLISLLIIIFALFEFTKATHNSQKSYADSIVTNSLNYIYNSQLTTGELPSSLCSETSPNTCSAGNNVFITSSALYSLIETNKILHDKKITEVINKSLSFLYSQRDQNDLWRFWVKDYNDTLNPDLDDTSITSFLLEKYFNKQLNNLIFFEKNKLLKGSYYTWIPNNLGKNEVDISVNSNIILYLNLKNTDISDICNYLNNVIKNDAEKQELYTWNSNVVYYNYSKAYQSGVSCLVKSKDKIIQKITASQKENGSVDNSVLSTSMAVLSLLNYGDNNNAFLAPAISYIKNTISGNHFPGDFYFYATSHRVEYLVKSDVFSTILAIEAIVRYEHLLPKN